MTGHKPFGELTKGLAPARRAGVEAKAAALHESRHVGPIEKTA